MFYSGERQAGEALDFVMYGLGAPFLEHRIELARHPDNDIRGRGAKKFAIGERLACGAFAVRKSGNVRKSNNAS